MQLTGIKTRIETRDVEALVEFYSRIIGLSIVQNWGTSSGAILGFNIESNGFLEIAHATEPKVRSDLSLQFRVQSLSEFIAHVNNRWPHSKPMPRPWGSTYVYLKDPDGVEVIVFEGDV